MYITGREREQKELRDCVDSTCSEFLVVYGRRRVGKTYLVRQFFNDEFAFYATGVPETKTREQLKVFGMALSYYGSTEKNSLRIGWKHSEDLERYWKTRLSQKVVKKLFFWMKCHG